MSQKDQPSGDAKGSRGDGTGKDEKNFFIFVDGEKFEPASREMTPNQIIREAAQLDPTTHYLRKRHGSQDTSYQGVGDVPITLEKAERFEIISTGATPVS